MINISNLFSNEQIKSKESTFNRSKTKSTPSPSLNQGKKFKNYQNKIENSLEKTSQLFEGFSGMTNNNINNTSVSGVSGLSSQTQNVSDASGYQQQDINILRELYKITLHEYKKLTEQIKSNITGYVDRTNSNNPYLNTTVSFSTGEVAYVTNQGVVKLIPSTQIWQTLAIPQTVQTQLNVPWSSNYNTPGTQIPTNPPLVSGTPIISGQSLGNEGTNVFVNQLLQSDVSSSYMGCYASSSNNDNMSFLGGSPPPLNGPQIQNGNFSQPALKNNTYQYITSASTVPGWYFGGTVLMNNSSAWQFLTPYPSGNQAVAIQKQTYIYTTLNLSTGINYTITFSGCSRPCCLSTNVGNPINLQLYTSANAFISTIANFTPSPVNTWQNFSYTFTVPTTQTYNLYFYGTSADDQSTAITSVALTSSNTSSGTYSYSACEQAAISSGYRYFGLQNADASTGLGYCAVSNSQPAITQYGNSVVPSQSITLWSSNTGNQTGNTALLDGGGTLQVISSAGQTIFSTPSSQTSSDASANDPYIGCYSYSKMSNIPQTGSNYQYTLDQCMDTATSQGADYVGYGGGVRGSNIKRCLVFTDLSSAQMKGVSTKCDTPNGGDYAADVYATDNSNSTGNCYLILQDDGNMVIYGGTGPNDNQGQLWASGTNGQTQDNNPAMVAQNGKYGQNWIASGSTLAPGDFVGSTNGNLALVMQTDGNLVLYTYQMVSNCQQMSDGNMGGGIGGNAVYDIGVTAISGNMGNLAYIDDDSNLYTYPSTNQQYNATYTTIQNSDTQGNDIQGAAFGNATIDSCQSACNTNSDCAGFVFDSANSYCWPKTNGMYPFGGPLTSDTNSTIYIRGRQPATLPLGVSQNTNGTNSVTYQNYINKGEVGSEYGLANATSVQKQQLQQLQSKMNLLASQITDLTNQFYQTSQDANNQSTSNTSSVNEYVKNISTMKKKMGALAGNDNNIDNILTDSDLIVLQKNYGYLFWSILAAGTVLVAMNIVKK
jgi:archaellum component FlaC